MPLQTRFLACVLMVAIPQRAPAQTSPGVPTYRDPQGRFTLRIPPGWNTVQINNDAVQFSSGAAYMTLLSLPGADPALTLNAVGTATGKQWKNFVETRRGPASFGERTGQCITYSGVNPMGSDSYIQLLDVTDGSLNYLLMTSAPKADFTRLKSAFDQIEQSFRLTAAVKVRDAGPPAPAGAIGISTTAPAREPQPHPAPPPLAVPPDAASVYRMKLVRIVDERGFERPMTALTLLVPTDWRFQGSVQHGQGTGCHANLVKLTFRATSPDGRLAFELFPGNTWQWTDDLNMRNMMQTSNQQQARFGVRGCDIMAPMTADAFLRREVLPAVRRDARVTGSEPMPDAEQQLREEASQLQQAAARQGMRVSVRTDVSRVRVSDVQNGAPMEEWFTAMTSSASMAGPSFNVRMGRMGQALYYTNSADHVFAMRAPQGQLDAQEKFFRLLMGTVRVDSQWQARVEQVIANLQAQDAKGANDRSAIALKAGQDQARIIHDSYQNATNSREHSMEGWSQYVRGVQTFRNPATGETVDLSNQYDHAWAGPDGAYLVTDSPNFNPNSSLNGRWTSLEPVTR